MAFTFNADLSDEVSQVRYLIGDTDSTSAVFQDDVIQGAVSWEESVYGAAAGLAEQLAAKYGRMDNISVDGLSIDYKSKSTFYENLAVRLRGTDGEGGVNTLGDSPFVGGTSVSETRSVASDTDRTPSAFSVVPQEPEPPEIR